MARYESRIAIVIAILFIISVLSPPKPVLGEISDDENNIIAAWLIEKYVSSSQKFTVIPATQGILREYAVITAPSIGSANRDMSINYAVSVSNYSVDSWSNGTNKNYWQLSFSTTGYSDIKFTASSWSTSNGPRDFAIDLSVDNGDSWTRIPDTDKQISDNQPEIPTWSISLPIEAKNKENIALRIIMTSNIATNSIANITSKSINRLNNISVYGKPIEPKIPKDQDPTDPSTDPNPPDNTDDPNKPDEQEIPQEPKEPNDSEVPEEPEDPVIPQVPKEPEIPETPELPEIPEIPHEPEIPEVPEEPDVPETPEIPKQPELPETPIIPEIPIIPETPTTPQAPYVPPVSNVQQVFICEFIETSQVDLPNPINDNELKISIEKLDNLSFPPHIQDIIGNHPIFNIKSYKGNTQIFNFDDERIIITLPYTLEKDEDKSGILVYYIDENNNISIVTTSYYDELTNQISFSTDHLSIYAIGYNKVNFNDIGNSLAKDYITYLAARNIVVGTGNNSFKPTNNITRAEFIKILSSLGFLSQDNHYNLSFSDVNPNDWYAPCIKWACENDITYGITTSKFNPNKYLTQEEMAVMIFRFLNKINYSFPPSSTTKIKDINSISSWAMDAVKKIQQSEIIDKLNHEFIPNSTVTREEVATIISIILQYMSSL